MHQCGLCGMTTPVNAKPIMPQDRAGITVCHYGQIQQGKEQS